MFKIVRLNKKLLEEFRHLQNRNIEFNELNEDFFDVYENSNFTQQFFLRRCISLLLYNDIPIGYIWTSSDDNYLYSIKCLYINTKYIIKNDIKDSIQALDFLLNSLKKNCIYTFTCKKNEFNYIILEGTGFKKEHGTIQLYFSLNKDVEFLSIPKGVEIVNFRKGYDEEYRCNIQNEVFKSSSRIPLTVEDIFYDELQSYYYDPGAVLLKSGDEFIGYGQIIIDRGEPFIVNLGVLSEYRGKHYGKILILYLVNLLKHEGFEHVRIKVDSSNVIAFNLYSKVGFITESETNLWKLKR
ncbi:GNAT family N-acetyltransferase [Clostridium sp. JN-9]|uniref:GNAT family N-acetyltransferase n=1 Tax=Clostridium sp. JN-9 TaxID=2507159 RepID=UPI000FFDFFD6|nr:GNAT family N-acetyltransferase [Clostridium sp. JN-9]QAT40237.1 GNAT family N-acetyltransferase [Clostridium sp. JN-9]